MTLVEPAQVSARSNQRAAGLGNIEIALVSGQSSAIDVQAHSPLKILVPRPRGQSVWTYISNFGGGLLPGDVLDVSISVRDGARCFVGTQSSTKIFRAGPKGAVKSHLNAEVGAGALLVYTPDVAQGFADSRYIQRQAVHLADETSSLVFLDWYCAGRSARGERWAFAEYASRTEIRAADKLTFLDSVRLDRTDDLISLPERMGRANCAATLSIVGTDLKAIAQKVVAEISQLPISKRADALIVASAIPNGAVIRVAGVSVEAVAREIFPRLSFITPLLGDNPFQRKW